ncbi:MAG: 16S rRNA (guanine(966)-N(2))-methyltransferase RsmD [Firmicutes bacterium]|nr:16S rRNA (guanine(966)-N(2))-methyltransferase RsmD [Bacillota bacterium]
MQIISGRFRGKRLTPLCDKTTRPTTNRVRENIFNLVSAKVRGAVVLDLFGGTGAFSAECLSRGAKSVIVNDIDSHAVAIIKQNTALCKTHDISILNMDYIDALNKLKLKGYVFDLVFLDPPYETDFGLSAINFLVKNDMLAQNAIIAFETGQNIIYIEEFDIRSRKYGRAWVHILARKPAKA